MGGQLYIALKERKPSLGPSGGNDASFTETIIPFDTTYISANYDTYDVFAEHRSDLKACDDSEDFIS